MTKCYSGITIPQQIQEPCLGKYTSTDCSLSPNANIILDLPSGASQTETNAALTTALVYKEQQIEDLQNSILTIDGSETKVEAGDNVTVTGTGTNLNPYVVNALSGGSQDLQSVLDIGGYAEVDLGNSTVELVQGVENERYTQFIIDNTALSLDKDNINFSNFTNLGKEGGFNIQSGILSFKQYSVNSIKTTITIDLPTINADISFPAKSVSGSYKINTTDDNIYLVSTLPSAVLNDMAIVSDATAPTYLGALVGGGSVVTPVWHNGTIWVSR